MRKIHRLSKVITASTAILNTLCLVLLGPNTARALCDWSKKREFRLYSGQKAGSESPLRLALRRVGSWAMSRLAGNYVPELQLPGPIPLIGSAAVIVTSAVVASLVPAARTSTPLKRYALNETAARPLTESLDKKNADDDCSGSLGSFCKIILGFCRGVDLSDTIFRIFESTAVAGSGVLALLLELPLR